MEKYELEEENRDLRHTLANKDMYAKALCAKLAERDAEIKALRELLFERGIKTENK